MRTMRCASVSSKLKCAVTRALLLTRSLSLALSVVIFFFLLYVLKHLGLLNFSAMIKEAFLPSTAAFL